jgi:hypothetical protein
MTLLNNFGNYSPIYIYIYIYIYIKRELYKNYGMPGGPFVYVHVCVRGT